MIERDLDIDNPATPVERRLDVACALVRVLIARSAGDGPVERAEALALFEELTLPAAVFDAGRGSPLANGAWRALLGARGAIFPGTHLDEVLRTGAAIHVAELALALEGPPEHCAATLRPIRNDAGATTGVIVLCTLITDEVIARELAVSPGALVWGGAAAGGPDYFNGAWGTYTRGARRLARRSSWQDAIHPDDRPRCMQAFGEATGRGGAAEIEVRVRRADDEYRWHRIRFASAPASRWYAVAADIEDARAEAAREELLARERVARADAEQANRAKDQFLAAVSHELRAPLTTMLLWERVLRDETADVALRAQALDAIHESAQSQSRLVGDLLDVSRAISGKLHVDLRPLDIESVLRAALEAIAPAALAKQIALDRRGERVVVEVQGDDARLRQVLDNLLANAVKFTERGGRVAVVVARRERSIAIDIEDSGRGIAPDFLPRVFEPFSQLDDSSTRLDGGLGLGLAIAKQIVALHHGELTAASAGPGRGSTFTLQLPIADEQHARSPSGGTARRPTLAHVRVLVIDDEPRVRDALALLLDRAGAVVDTAESAETARIRIALQAPEVLVCDIAMPAEDGNSFIRALRASGRDIPAIALTAHAMEADVSRALAAGFDLHVAKPIDFERLVENIGGLVAAHRAGART
jgi:signal transduction histidine kinase